jgi:hypothetical protein
MSDVEAKKAVPFCRLELIVVSTIRLSRTSVARAQA